ncbi:MAG: hypothetical protein EXQ86_11245 [Rhodospirillales bacterium]|nr:hypothetical protein [Rhodospirillales bacterium]
MSSARDKEREAAAARSRAMLPLLTPARMYDRLTYLLFLVLAIIVVLTFRDYSISNDEEVQHTYGKWLLVFYSSGFSDWTAFHYKDLYLYGGLFDIVAALLAPLFPFSEYDTRHLLSGLVGIVGIAGTWRLARHLGGPRAGFLAAVLLALTASYYGAMFNNTKDVPFAAAMVWLSYYMCRAVADLPRPKRWDVILMGVAAGCALGIRVAALIAGFYVLVGIAVRATAAARDTSLRAALKEAGRNIIVLLPAAAVAYVLMGLFWPWSVFSPFNPVLALQTFSHYVFDIDTMLAGEKMKMSKVSALYLPIYLAVKMPESVLAGLVVALGLGAGYVLRRSLRDSLWRSPAAVQYLLVGLAAFFPVAVASVMHVPNFNGIRHFIFVIPPLVALAGVGVDSGWRWLSHRAPRMAQFVTPALVTVAVLQSSAMVQLHPHQYVYYNSLVGGLEGADDTYEMDYWSNSARELTFALAHHLELENEGRPVERIFTVAFCNERTTAVAYLPPFLRYTSDWRSADFFVSTTHMGCDDQLDGRVIVEVERQGAVLGVVEDRRHLKRATAQMTVDRP